MSTYGRNFEFRVQPHQGQRASRYVIPADGDDIPFGAPVEVIVADGEDANGRLPVEVATGVSGPVSGIHGLAMYEWSYDAFSGHDQVLDTYSDKDAAPAGRGVYLVSGPQVKIVLRNTEDRSFYGQRDYAGRIMVAGLSQATPSVAVGDYLRPHNTPSDDNGYWVETATLAEAWLVITGVNADRGEVEARFLF
jgi:hypothetical protein